MRQLLLAKKKRHVWRWIGFVVVVCFAALGIRTLLFTSLQPPPQRSKPIEIDTQKVTRRLAESIKVRTISVPEFNASDRRTFLFFHSLLRRMFPRVHRQLDVEPVNDLSLLYEWKGTSPELQPVLFAAHMDVVPADPNSLDAWERPPFSGLIENGFIWGRGALDDKVSVVGILEAIDYLLKKGFQPERTIYLGFGHDEEMEGRNGARAIAARLQERGVKLEYVLDEGLFVTDGVMPGLESCLATIGIAEKGSVTYKVIARGEGGHSSVPPTTSAMSAMATAIQRLHRDFFPVQMDRVSKQFFRHLGPEFPWRQKAVFANLWLTHPFVSRMLAESPAANALIRTTISFTVIDGGQRENVMPREVTALANLRLFPGETVESAKATLEEAIADLPVTVEVLGGGDNPVLPSATDSRGYTTLAATIKEIFPSCIVAPSLVVPATDSRHYQAVADNIYRFLPLYMEPGDIPRFHGVNERITVDGYVAAVKFYIRHLERTSAR